MRKFLSFAFLFLLFFILFIKDVSAVYDPVSIPNNKFGIHILFPEEVKQASELINTNGGDWGYVTIPIKSTDKDIEKWQKFMDESRKYHVIPLIRLATEGDYFNTAVWEKPKYSDITDFANFLNSLDWPTTNRYVIVYNEVNRADEWGGQVNPQEYAELLSFSADEFKKKNPNFFIISAGLDNGADNVPGYMNQYTYLQEMNRTVPGVFDKIDGLSSHSYPNPGFMTPPNIETPKSIFSFRYEQGLVEDFCGRKLPVFITETGWTGEKISDKTIADYFTQAYTNIWSDESIVAVTPFLLKAGAPPFSQFSLIAQDNSETLRHKAIKNCQKVKGEPILTTVRKVLGEDLEKKLPVRNFKSSSLDKDKKLELLMTKSAIKWLLKIE